MTALPCRPAALAGLAALLLATACGSGASADGVAANDAAPVMANDADASVPRNVTAASMGGAARCPATLAAGATPAGGRMLGTAPTTPLPLSSATVTADAVAAVDAQLSGLAEVEPEDGPARAGIETQVYTVEPTAAAPHTLVCRYGAATPPLMAQAALLLPIAPRAGGYRCAVALPQGSDRRPVTAQCAAK